MSEKRFRYSKEILYDIEWQTLRVSLLKQYNDYGGWSNVDGTLTNIDKLREYFAAADLDEEAARRCYRCINLLAATMLGYPKQQTQLINICKKYHQELAQIYKHSEWAKIIAGGDDLVWDWNKVAEDLKTLYREDRQTFDNIEENILSRKKTADRKSRLGIGGMQYREELAYFMDLMLAAKEV